MPIKEQGSLGASVMHLLHRAGQLADEYFAEEMKDSALTPRQYAVLAVLAENEGSSQTQIVDATGIDRSTLADIVKRLVQRGFLARRRSRADARAYVVRLTPQGHSQLKVANPAAARASERVLRGLANGQRHDLVALLGQMIGTARQSPVVVPIAAARR